MKLRLMKIFGVVAIGLLTGATAMADAVRYVSTAGSDENDGSQGSPWASIPYAVAQLGTDGGTIYVDSGIYEYDEDYNPTQDPAVTNRSLVVLSAPIRIIGATGNPADVTIRRKSGNKRLRVFWLKHAGAMLRYLTIADGYLNINDKSLGCGGNVKMSAGLVADCVLRDGTTWGWAESGANAYVSGGVMTRCELIGGYINTKEQSQYIYAGTSLVVNGGTVDNCVIRNCGNPLASDMGSRIGPAPVAAISGTLSNCNIYSNRCYEAGGVAVNKYNGAVPSIFGCRFWDNEVVMNDPPEYASVYCVAKGPTTGMTEAQVVNVFDACQAPFPINSSCSILSAPPFVPGLSAVALDGVATMTVSLPTDAVESLATVAVFRDGQQVDLLRRRLAAGESWTKDYSGPGAYAFKLMLSADGFHDVRWADAYVPGDAAAVFVSVFGSDENPGTYDRPMLTIPAAKATLAGGGRIYLFPGIYTSDEHSFALHELHGPSALSLDGPYQLVGLAGDPSKTTLLSGRTTDRVICLTHAEAALRCVTLANGRTNRVGGDAGDSYAFGGNVWLKLGAVENCIIRDGFNDSWAGGGANVLIAGGRLSGCDIVGGTVKATDFWKGSYVWSYNGSSVDARGGIIENCVIRNCTSGSGPICLWKTATMINSTVKDNGGKVADGLIIGNNGGSNNVKVVVANCDIHALTNIASCTRQNDGITVDPALTVRESCIFNDERPVADAGEDYSALGGVSRYDIEGNERLLGVGYDVGAYESEEVAFLIGEKSFEVVDGKAVLSLTFLNRGLGQDVRLIVFRDGVQIAEEKYLRHRVGTITREYTEQGFYMANYVVKNEQGTFRGMVGRTYLGGDDVKVRFLNPGDSIQAAVDSLGEAGGRIYLAPGEYKDSVMTNTIIKILTPAKIVGTGNRPEDVVVCKGSQAARLFLLNNSEAAVRMLTVKGGYIWEGGAGAIKDPDGNGCGGNIHIASGSVENCLVNNGGSLFYSGGGGNVYLGGGRLANCRLTGGVTHQAKDVEWCLGGGSICAYKGGVIENCIITDCHGDSASNEKFGGAPVILYGDVKMYNCSVYGNIGWESGAMIIAKASGKLPAVVNCAMYDNVALGDGGDGSTCLEGSQHNGLVTPRETALEALTACSTNNATALIDTGVAFPGTARYDIQGAPRTSGAATDIGAYEYYSPKLNPDGLIYYLK